ncbi:hypothetical protein [Metabacillus sp. FJAT-53654]|uniref:Uncharacterized protein n=1 Tax=Metabacillus rhizosphaerae TaxID=3117747 RepID=A0ABZ2MWQ5_9BACI
MVGTELSQHEQRFSIDECTTQFNRESKKQKHDQELKLIQKLQMISYH